MKVIKIATNGRDFSRFNGLNPLIKEVPKGIPTDKIPTDKRKPEGISFIGGNKHCFKRKLIKRTNVIF